MVRKTSKFIVVAAACLSLAAFAGCGDDDSPTGGGNGGGSNPIPVSGTVTKAPINASSVDLFNFTAGGGMGAMVAGSFMTDVNGAWSGEVPAGTAGPLLIRASGGSYIDESTAQTVNVGSNLYGILQVGLGVGNATPVTHTTVINAQARIANGASLQTAITDAISEITTALGYDPTSTDASPLPTQRIGANTPTAAYSTLLAGFSELLSTAPGGFGGADTWDMVIGLAEDMTDGVLQGIDAFGANVIVDPGTGTPIQWPSLDSDDISNLVDAANTWANANSVANISNPDLSNFGDVSNQGGGGDTPTGSVFLSGAVTGTFVPVTGINQISTLVWTDPAKATISVSAPGGVVTQVGYASVQGTWIAFGAPVPNVSVNGSTASFNGAVLTNPLTQSTITLNKGSLGFE